MASCTIETSTQLELFEELMEHSHGDCSVFMTAIDKIEKITVATKFSNSEKAKMIAVLATQIVPSITGQAMTTSFEMSKNQDDARYEYPLLEAKSILAEAQAEQAENAAKYEYLNVNAAQVSADTSTKNAAISEMKADIHEVRTSGGTNGTVTKEIDMLRVKADTATQRYANAQYSNTTRGFDVETAAYSVDSKAIGVAATADYEYAKTNRDKYLINRQTDVQERIICSFIDNKYQHAANSSSQMLATLIGADSWEVASQHLDTWNEAMDHLVGSS